MMKKKLNTDKPLLQALTYHACPKPPIWLMRQAGRYLPEYRELRAKSGGFLNMVYAPEIAAEITMQPIKRYGMDGAILFSDILIVPHAMGQELWFAEGEGPKLGGMEALENQQWDPDVFDKTAGPVYETVSIVKEYLQKPEFNKTALIGFAGAPWTVATYMVEQKGGHDFSKVKTAMREDPEKFGILIKKITEATIHYLLQQIKAGAETVKIFDSWAGELEGDDFKKWVISPAKEICKALHQDFPEIPVIGFPKGAGCQYGEYVDQTGVDAVALDQFVSLEQALELQEKVTIQGNLAPELLLAGGTKMTEQVEQNLEKLARKPFIFNLGHGVIKETPPENVKALVSLVRGSPE